MYLQAYFSLPSGSFYLNEPNKTKQKQKATSPKSKTKTMYDTEDTMKNC